MKPPYRQGSSAGRIAGNDLDQGPPCGILETCSMARERVRPAFLPVMLAVAVGIAGFLLLQPALGADDLIALGGAALILLAGWLYTMMRNQ